MVQGMSRYHLRVSDSIIHHLAWEFALLVQILWTGTGVTDVYDLQDELIAIGISLLLDFFAVHLDTNMRIDECALHQSIYFYLHDQRIAVMHLDSLLGVFLLNLGHRLSH